MVELTKSKRMAKKEAAKVDKLPQGKRRSRVSPSAVEDDEYFKNYKYTKYIQISI